jgi:hypothetical protein
MGRVDEQLASNGRRVHHASIIRVGSLRVYAFDELAAHVFRERVVS